MKTRDIVRVNTTVAGILILIGIIIMMGGAMVALSAVEVGGVVRIEGISPRSAALIGVGAIIFLAGIGVLVSTLRAAGRGGR